MIREQLSKKKFEAWLMSKPYKNVFAQTSNDCDCPIAKYLTETLSLKDVHVNSDTSHPPFPLITYNNGSRKILILKVNRWVRIFIYFIDADYPRQKVTPKQCLITLRDVIKYEQQNPS